ncbi:MAG: HEPN domain-containing protein [Candidatus Pacearchaeota archaeon]|nr:HEPN domain-containing protein [Candidatus Pacearchaeota archaeon]
MNFERLLNEGKIEKVKKTDFSSESAEKSLVFARRGFETENYDEIMSVIYNGIFKITNRLMNFLGYRAIGREHHKNTFEFLREIGIDQDLVQYFDNIRKKRNDFVYRDMESITREEAEKMIIYAEEFVKKIINFVKKSKDECSKK